MIGIKVGGKWEGPDAHKALRIEPFVSDPSHSEALARVINETLRTDYSLPQLQELYMQPSFELERDARLVFLGERPVAAAICYPGGYSLARQSGNFEIFVVPAARRRGLGSRLLAHLAAAARARGHRVLETIFDPQQQEEVGLFLLYHGFNVVGGKMHLARKSLEDLPTSGLPPG